MKTKEKIVINYFILLLLLFIDSLGNGVSRVLLPEIIHESGLGIQIFGMIATVQSFIGIFILLPQANFIKHFGEIQCVRFGVFINIIVYILYSVGSLFTVAFGKFTEGFADRLLNSSFSKLVYDYTDEFSNRGKYRALLDIIGNVGSLLGPIVVGFLVALKMDIAFPFIITVMIIGLLISFRFLETNRKVEQIVKEEKNKKNYINTYFFEHINLYKKNKRIIILTIPTFLFSCFDIFESLLLGQFLLENKGMAVTDLAMFWTFISAITLAIQYPLGVLADKNKTNLLFISIFCLIIGFLGLLFTIQTPLILLFGVMIYIGGSGYSMAMSVLFGDMTSKENRLSESEVYRMIRLIGSGIFSLMLTFIFEFNQYIALTSIMILIFIASIITFFCSKYMYSGL